MNDIAEKYFKLFSEKDLEGLDELFDADATLRDWEIEATGLEEVLKTYKNIFESVDNIKVRPLRIYNDGNIVVAELDIDINNGQEKILVVDIIEYNKKGKICAIRAFKG